MQSQTITFGSSDKYRGQPISVDRHSTMAQYFSNLGAVLK